MKVVKEVKPSSFQVHIYLQVFILMTLGNKRHAYAKPVEGIEHKVTPKTGTALVFYQVTLTLFVLRYS